MMLNVSRVIPVSAIFYLQSFSIIKIIEREQKTQFNLIDVLCFLSSLDIKQKKRTKNEKCHVKNVKLLIISKFTLHRRKI